MRILKTAFVFFWYAILVVMLAFNVALYFRSPLARSSDAVPPKIPNQLAGIADYLDRGSAARMQFLFPEGNVFSYLFYGLAWVEVGLRDEKHQAEAIEQANWALDFVDRPEAFAPFPDGLLPDHGMFYSSWRAELLAGVILLQQGQDAEQLSRLKNECDSIATTLRQSSTPFPPSYNHSSWPCDTLPGVHAMAVYDAVTKEDRYAKPIEQWLERISVGIDSETGLITHYADPHTGTPASVARATSQMIILRMLPDIDSDLAVQQYQLFRDQFFTTTVGLPSVKEFPHGKKGSGDVDSGPLIFGCSPSATVMAIGVAQIYGDQEWADAVAVTGEAIGLPFEWNGKRKYALGLMPIGDEIVAYSYVARPWIAGPIKLDNEYRPSKFWRWPMHGLLLAMVLITVILRRRQQKRQTDS